MSEIFVGQRLCAPITKTLEPCKASVILVWESGSDKDAGALAEARSRRARGQYCRCKEVGQLRRIRARGRTRVDMAFSLTASAFNLIRLPKLDASKNPRFAALGMMEGLVLGEMGDRRP